MKKKGIWTITGIAILAIGLIGGAMAASAPDGKTKGAISTKGIGIAIKHDISEEDKEELGKQGVTLEYDEDGSIKGLTCKVLPGAKIQDRIHIENTKENPVYVRVTINKAWSDKEGNKTFDFNASDIEVLKDGTALTSNADWYVQSYDDEETLYCYYLKPISGGETSAELIDMLTIFAKNSSEVGNELSGYQANISFEADAIQKTAAKDAMLAEWGVMIETDSAGNITSITEQ